MFYTLLLDEKKVSHKTSDSIMWYHIWISTFLIELHLDDVLEVLLVVGSKIYQNDT